MEEVPNMMLKNASSARRGVRWLPFAPAAAMLVAGMQTVSPVLAQQIQTVTVVLTDRPTDQPLQFTPKTITLTVGQPVQLNIQNSGKADHNLSSRDAPDSIPISNVKYQKADNDPRQLRSYEIDSILDADVNSGSTSVVTFTPTKVGTFRFISNAGDDEMNGMVGSFVVVAPGGQSPATSAPAANTGAAASTGSGVARDGQSLSGQPAATQAMFKVAWGDGAAQRWVQEHEAELTRLGR
jgi:uncharacterized cupredoxin-like copper-binding protein